MTLKLRSISISSKSTNRRVYICCYMSIKIAISLQNLLVLVAEIEIKSINKINLINDQKRFL